MTARPSSDQNVAYFSGSFSSIVLTVDSTFFTSRLRISWICRSCCRISREMLSDRSFASTTPLTKRRYSGTSASQSSMMNTRLTYSCTPRLLSRMNRSIGAWLGRNSSAWYSKVPSADSRMVSSGGCQSWLTWW